MFSSESKGVFFSVFIVKLLLLGSSLYGCAAVVVEDEGFLVVTRRPQCRARVITPIHATLTRDFVNKSFCHSA